VLRCNLDETSVCINHHGQRGVITARKAQVVVLLKDKPPKRGSLTHVALNCDDTAVQSLLPQFILGNEHVLKVGEMQEQAEHKTQQEPVHQARAGNADEDGERNAPPAMMGSPHVDVPCSQTESWQDRLRPRPAARRQHPPACVSPREEAACPARVASAAHPAPPCQSSTSLPARVTMQQAHKRPAGPRPRALARARTARASTTQGMMSRAGMTKFVSCAPRLSASVMTDAKS